MDLDLESEEVVEVYLEEVAAIIIIRYVSSLQHMAECGIYQFRCVEHNLWMLES